MENFTRQLLIGHSTDGDVWITVAYQDGRLSITGTVGAKRNGDAARCGQCDSVLTEPLKLAPEWTPAMVTKLAEVWERWHLNNMRAGCEHQRAAEWNKRPIDPSKPTNTYGKHFPGQKHDSWNMLTWIRRDEHPEGLMCEPCPECGYKFGTAWLSEDVPEDVLTWLSELPLPVGTNHRPRVHPWGSHN